MRVSSKYHIIPFQPLSSIGASATNPFLQETWLLFLPSSHSGCFHFYLYLWFQLWAGPNRFELHGNHSLLTLARTCTANGYCSWSVGRSVRRLVNLLVCDFVSFSARFLSNRGCCRYQTWICGYMQRALGTA